MADPPSFWSLKPWWCQPWSIAATGVVTAGGSWWLLHRWWITLPLSVAVLLWWGLFLVLAPRAYRESVAGGVKASGAVAGGEGERDPEIPPQE